MSDDTITIDLHSMRFIQAKTELLDTLEGYCHSGYTTFHIIHGYHGGRVLKSYVREKLKKDFEQNNPHYVLIHSVFEKGTTTISIRTNKR